VRPRPATLQNKLPQSGLLRGGRHAPCHGR
jgi:hypothetical protein